MKEFLQDQVPPTSSGAKFDPDNTVEIMHEQTKWYRGTFNSQLRDIVLYLTHPSYISRGAAGYNEFPSYPLISLPEPTPVTIGLAEAMCQRRSAYKINGPVDLADISAILHHAIRVNRQLTSTAAPNVKVSFRPYPSPGGLYPTEMYVFLNDVDGTEPCLAHYDARAHALRVIKTHDGNLFKKVQIHSVEDDVVPPVVFVLTTVPQRVTVKYGARGYRMGLLEVGHASQNICLVTQALGLGSLVYGSYFDDELAGELEIDSVTEAVASVILVGKVAK
jgi:SagB-type dehydrogenase family enzyme